MTQSVALETVNYVMRCLHANERDLAKSAVMEQDNGLSKEQRDAILKLIQESGRESVLMPGLEQIRFDNRLLGVVQPATLEVMQTPDILAELHLLLKNSPGGRLSSTTLMVQVEPKAVKQGLFKAETLHAKFSELLALRGDNGEQIGFTQMMARVHNLESLELDAISNMLVVARVIRTQCPRLERIQVLGDISNLKYVKFFKDIARELAFSGGDSDHFANELIPDLKTFSRLEAISTSRLSSNTFTALVAAVPLKRMRVLLIEMSLIDQLKALEKCPSLEAYTIFEEDITQEVLNQLLKLKSLRYLDFTNVMDPHKLTEKGLMYLAKMPQLQILDVREARKIDSLEMITKLLDANKSIQKVIVDYRYIYELRDQDCSQILSAYPQIIVKDPYSGKLYYNFEVSLLEQIRPIPPESL